MPLSEPIISGYHPDPSIVRVDDGYWLANSSFEYFPGVPIHYSSDLLHWELVGHVFERPSTLPLDGDEPSLGTYAPTLRYHDGLFWLTVTNVGSQSRGQLIVHTTDPRQGWSAPVTVPDTPGIDPDLSWDEEGRCRLTWRRLGSDLPGGTRIRSVVINPWTGERLSEDIEPWQGTGWMTDPEGPHLYRKDGWWYLLLAEGGTCAGHCVTLARARTVDGPWEEHPANPFFTHRGRREVVQATGHGDLVVGPDGRWSMVHLGTRPRGAVPEFHVNGRETFIVGIDWDAEGWPYPDEDRWVVPAHVTSWDDDLRGQPGPVACGDDPWDLHPRWVSPGGLVRPALSRNDDGRLCITAVEPDGRAGVPVLATRTRDEYWSARLAIHQMRVEGDGGGEAVLDLTVAMDRYTHASVRLTFSAGDGLRVQAITQAGDLGACLGSASLRGDTCTLFIRAQRPQRTRYRLTGPDELVLGYVDDTDEDVVVGQLDGRYVSTEMSCGFTGRVVGMRCCAGSAVLESFSYHGQR